MNVALIDSTHDHDASFRLMRLVEWAGFSLPAFTRVKVEDIHQGGSSDLPIGAVLVTMGEIAAKQMGVPGHLLKERGYLRPWNGHHLIPTVHPWFIQRGGAKWSAAFINDVQKAAHISEHGVPLEFQQYLLDPSPMGAYQWAQDYITHLNQHPDTQLAFDIETPGKPDDEDELDLADDLPDRTWNIERIGFSYLPHQALSIPWGGPYQAAISLVLGSIGDKIVWNAGFDVPRVRRAGTVINGTIHDGMVMWHILHSDQPKRLAHVATFTCPTQPAWKHLSGSRPAYYNATDADVELRSVQVITGGLHRAGLWDVYQRDVLDLQPVLDHMQSAGVPVDAGIRYDRAVKLADAQRDTRGRLEELFPLATRKIDHIYVKDPKDKHGLLSRPGTRSTTRCSICGIERPRKDHFKRFVKKLNPCADGHVEEFEKAVEEWYRLAEFSPSRDQLIRYHQQLKRPLPTAWEPRTRERKVKFDEERVKGLILKHPDDQVYPLVLTYRSLDKLAGTYIGRPIETTNTHDGGSTQDVSVDRYRLSRGAISGVGDFHPLPLVVGGIEVGHDGRVHTTFGHNPSSLRLCSFDPNLQNIPRGGSKEEKWVKDMFVAPSGSAFWERDFSGIEAVLVGYFAGAAQYVRLARRDVHSFYTAYALNALEPGRISANDLPLLSWDDGKLFSRLGDLKREFGPERNGLYKHLVHGANYLQTPGGAQKHIFKQTSKVFPVGMIAKVMGVYFELFPEITKWHKRICQEVDGTKRHEGEEGLPSQLGVCYARNPFGYVHHFYNVLEWTKANNEWISTFGEDAKRLVSFLPQSTAAAIIKKAAKELYNTYPWVGQTLRLLIHDSVFGEAAERDIQTCLDISARVMEAPLRELPLDPSWGMGEFLSIGSESKVGQSWGEMH